MIHKACMPVYMNSGKIVADGRTGRVDGKSKVLQEVLADLKRLILEIFNYSLEDKLSQVVFPFNTCYTP